MKSTLSALAAAVMAFGIMSCNNQPQANDTKETARPAAATASAGSQQIAYVEIDSIMGQYKDTRSQGEEHTENTCRKTAGIAAGSRQLPTKCTG